ncbi:integrase catalytic domain-containing protein [Flavobacterium johnsoniae]|uniref:Integrase core domain-containing protein n=1 Tax=Flavobacterium johnsoniae TaxID=986 RepID=A0A1M5WBQ9_FLAJO|nr:DDE-type integrase/transposase/recombinase [Flavobacterium johnsoniae]SHH84887.1 Integrase core domain-containing protein [Flavobacterium johnsoniae]
MYIDQCTLESSFLVPVNLIKTGTKRYRKGVSKSWANKKDVHDRRRVLIDLDSIPDLTRKKYNLPTGAEYKEQLNEQVANELYVMKEKERQTELFEAEKRSSYEFQALLDAYNNDYRQYVPLYREHFSYNMVNLEKRAIQSAKDHAFWLAMIDITGSVDNVLYGMAEKAYHYYMRLKENIILGCKINNALVFKRKLKAVRDALKANESLIPIIVDGASKPRPEKAKTNDFHKGLAIVLLSHPKKHSYRAVADLLNHHSISEGLEPITESWIKKMMRENNEVRTIVNKGRHGQKYFNDKMLPHGVRILTPYPANVWMIDGTPVQFYCWNEGRTKILRLNLFAVIDVCSRKIVGFDISYTEDKINIMNALKLAAKSEGHLPSEIVSDHFSARKTEEILELKAQMDKLGTSWRHSKVGNPQDKTYIERFWGVFQTVYCSLYDDYIGEGITSKRLGGRPAPEVLMALTKKSDMPTFNEMRSRIAEIIVKYNETATSKRQSPNDVYKLEKPNACEMNPLNTALMFWYKTSHTVRNGMVKITVSKKEYCYEIHNHKHKAMLQDQKVTVRYNEKELDSIMLFDQHDNVICECKKSLTFNIAEVDRTEEDNLNTYAHVAKNKSYTAYLDGEKQEYIDKALEVVNKKVFDVAHPLSLEKNQINSKESKELLELYYYDNSIPPDAVQQKQYKPIVTITKTGVARDVRETLLERKSIKKGSKNEALEIVQRRNDLEL